MSDGIELPPVFRRPPNPDWSVLDEMHQLEKMRDAHGGPPKPAHNEQPLPSGQLRQEQYTIVGAGITGLTIARILADHGIASTVYDRRDHIGGNCFDELSSKGVLIHRYGPHIFRTSSAKVVQFLSEFTGWRPYEHRVLSKVQCPNGELKLLPVPINATTLEGFFNVSLPEEDDARKLLDSLKIRQPELRTSEQLMLSQVGPDLYEAMFRGYTRKQWGREPSELDRSVCGRIPVRTNRDDRYFSDEFQAMPLDGYTAMFEKMADHPLIDVQLGVEIGGFSHRSEPKRPMIWTGCLDQLFGYAYGELPWRSLEFALEERFAPYADVQEAPVINEPREEIPFTRSTEYRQLTGQRSGWSALHFEYPSASGEPYYPVPSDAANDLAKRYRTVARGTADLDVAGRLGRYQYLEMGQAVAGALKLAKEILERH